MTEYIHLIGTEDVAKAGHNMQAAAEQNHRAALSMQDAAATIDRAVAILGGELEHHRQWSETMQARIENLHQGLGTKVEAGAMTGRFSHKAGAEPIPQPPIGEAFQPETLPPAASTGPENSFLKAPVAFTKVEGGSWIPWESITRRAGIFAVKFDDGTIFDCINGWR